MKKVNVTEICQFKKGDIIIEKNKRSICLYKGQHHLDIRLNDYYCGYLFDTKKFIVKEIECTRWGFAEDYRLATEEEKQVLFDAIKANGYKWNAKTKTLKRLNKTKSEKLYGTYISVLSKLEIQIENDLKEIIKCECLPLYSKISVRSSFLMFSNNYIDDIFIKKGTTNFYVTLENGEVILFSTLPIETRYNLLIYILKVKNNGYSVEKFG